MEKILKMLVLPVLLLVLMGCSQPSEHCAKEIHCAGFKGKGFCGVVCDDKVYSWRVNVVENP